MRNHFSLSLNRLSISGLPGQFQTTTPRISSDVGLYHKTQQVSCKLIQTCRGNLQVLRPCVHVLERRHFFVTVDKTKRRPISSVVTNDSLSQ